MKHFLLLSIVIFNGALLCAQCDDLDIDIFISNSDVPIAGDFKSLCTSTEPLNLIASVNSDTLVALIYFDVAGEKKDTLEIFPNDTVYTIGIFNLMDTSFVCPEINRRLTISRTKPVGISFINENGFAIPGFVNICTNNPYQIIPNVSNTNNYIYQWTVEDELVQEKDTLMLNVDTTAVLVPKLAVIDSMGCILYKDSLVVNVYAPPTFTSFEVMDALTCTNISRGTVSFGVNNPYEEFSLSYAFDNGIPSNIINPINTSFGAPIGNNYPLSIIYNELSGCSTDTTFTITSPDALSIEFELPDTSYCVGDILLVYVDMNDTITSKSWYINNDFQTNFSGKDTIDLILSEDLVGKLDIKLKYNYNNSSNNFCSAQFERSAMVYPKPSPQITSSSGGNPICPSDQLELSVDSAYLNYEWTVDDEIQESISSTITLSDLEANQYHTYSVWVMDANECSAKSDDASIFVNQGVDIISPNTVMQNDTLCDGVKVLYANSSNLNLNTTANRLFRNADLSVIEWNTSGNFTDNSSCGNVQLFLTELLAPNGIIKTFGTSNTLVFADADNSANHLNYQWFYIGLNEGADRIYHTIQNATERIIDCNNFDCLFAFSSENEGKILGLEIYDRRNGCTNLIFYDELGLFPGLKDIPVSVAEAPANHLFNLYPNLNNGSFYIQLYAPPTNPYILEIYNALGELIGLEQLVYQTIQQVNLPNIKAGIYFAVLKQEGRAIAQQKLIIH